MASVGAEDLGHCLAKRKTPASLPESFNQERFPAGTAGAGGDSAVPAHAHSPEARRSHAVPPRCARARAGNHALPAPPQARHPAAGPGWVGRCLEGGPRLGGWKRTSGRTGAGSREGPGGEARGPGAPGQGGCAAAVRARPAPPLAPFLALQPPP